MSRKLRPRCPKCGYRVDDIKKHEPRCVSMTTSRNETWAPKPKRIRG